MALDVLGCGGSDDPPEEFGLVDQLTYLKGLGCFRVFVGSCDRRVSWFCLGARVLPGASAGGAEPGACWRLRRVGRLASA